jgi:hypothetical protein
VAIDFATRDTPDPVRRALADAARSADWARAGEDGGGTGAFQIPARGAEPRRGGLFGWLKR